MPLVAGSRLGPFEIVAPIGAGGMGEVYQARDTRLDRTVAIKVLPDSLAADPEFRERFDREARVISQLTHPNICALFDVGRDGAVDYLVLEYLEGETLAARIARGALKIDDALRISSEIAQALDAAHRVGIVHRDLKPGNVMMTRNGAKLLDFGLAKSTAAVAGAGGRQSDLTSTPTVSSPLTTHGTILGTFQYMAPEQVEGREADARSDIWAFGCILYEMLTGRKAFAAKTQAGLIGAILEQEPKALLDLRPSAPGRIGWVLALCLDKDPDKRWQHVRDVRHALSEAGTGDQPTARRSKTTRRRLAFAIAGIVVTAAGVASLTVLSMRGERARTPVRLVVLPAEGTEVTGGPAAPQAAISPDGTRIVFSAFDVSRKTRLYLRPLDALEPRPIDGTEDGELPFWSPDGRSIGFFSGDGTLKTIALDGGPAHTVCELAGSPRPRGGGAWSREGVILFSAGTGLALQRVPAAGGIPEPATSLDHSPLTRSHMWPSFLADGRRFLFLVTSDDPAVRGIYVGALGSKDTTRLVDSTVAAAFAPPNYVLFVRDGTVLAQPLDAGASRLTGEPKPVAERVAYNPAGNLGRAAFTVSNTGVLVYRAGDVSGLAMAQLTWVDRKGMALGTVGPPGRRRAFELSPDETRVAVSQYDQRGRQTDIWVIDATGSGRTRVTSDPSDETEVIWSPDGERLVFVSARRGGNMYVKAASSSATEELLFESPAVTIPKGWSDDGRFLIYTALDPQSSADLWLVPMTGDRTPRPLVKTAAQETDAQLSRDGRWLAYASDESGAYEVYVQPFPPSGPQWQVSRNGGTEPRWRGDGKELYYISSSGKLMAVEVKTGAAFASAPPEELFQITKNAGEANGYMVSRDGRRFLVDRIVEQTGAAITVVVDWTHRLNDK